MVNNKLTASDQLEGLSDEEQRSIDSHSTPSAALVHETIRAEGEAELERGNVALALSGVAAGLSIGMSLLTQAVLRQHLPDQPWRELVVPLGYSAGFVIVVLGRQQLFTENTLTPILPLLFHKKLSILRHVLRLWGLVLVANLVATWLFSLFIAKTDAFDAPMKAAIAEVSRSAYAHGFMHTFLSAIIAGWLIALMVWILPAAGELRALMVVMMTYLIGLLQLSHSIASSVDAFYLVNTGEHTLAEYFTVFLIPTLLGNILGGTGLVAVLNYGQVADEIKN